MLTRTGARALIADPERRALAARLGTRARARPTPDERAADVDRSLDATPDALWLLNSTSGTTGLPKCVMHDQQRWFAFHDLAVAAADLRADDVFMSVLPAPFGFGIWTGHVTPTLLGAPTAVLPRFDAAAALALIERERVTRARRGVDPVRDAAQRARARGARPHRACACSSPAARWCRTTVPRSSRTAPAAPCSQFYGSNETGALSRTTLDDPRERRLRTAGRVIPEMHVRLFDDDGADVTATGGPGVAACKGAVNCLGYYDDPEANARLYTADGWMLTGDLCTIDDDGYLTVAGRASDFIIRGGKNISAAQVEDEVSTHPAVALAAAVAMPDPVFGERVCVYVELQPGADRSTSTRCARTSRQRGVGKELWPERLVVVDALPAIVGRQGRQGRAARPRPPRRPRAA